MGPRFRKAPPWATFPSPLAGLEIQTVPSPLRGFGRVVWRLGPQGCVAAPSAAASPWTTAPSPLTGAS